MNTVPHSTPVVVTIGSKGSASEEKETPNSLQRKLVWFPQLSLDLKFL